MNRALKFRAWDKRQKCMFQVNSMTFDAQIASGLWRVVAYPYDQWHKAENEQGEWADIPARSKADYLFQEVDVLEVMQFIGLQDKAGRDIYEGDILRYGFFALNDINKFGDKPWQNLPEGVEDSDITTTQSIIVVEWKFNTLYAIQQHIHENPDVTGVEIIGNIYENPELIGKEKKHS